MIDSSEIREKERELDHLKKFTTQRQILKVLKQ